MSKLGDTVTGARVLGSRVAAVQRRSNPEGRMPLMDHLRELRNRVLKAVAAILAGMVAGLIPQVHDPIWNIIYHPFQAAAVHDHAKLSVIGVLDPFTIWLQLAFWFGLIVTCPIWLYHPDAGRHGNGVEPDHRGERHGGRLGDHQRRRDK
jgi:hypothetical protein